MQPTKYFSLALISFLLSASGAIAADYRLGDRLKPNPPAMARAADYRDITWDDLMPKGWDPAAEFRGMDLSRLKDIDPRAIEALEKLRRVYDEAPVESSLNGQRIRLAGFAVPLERVGDEVSEFLLVPYFGACIHTPPPPANQAIHVFVKNRIKGMSTMDTVWVSGKIEAHRADSGLGMAGYRLQAETIRPYSKLSGGR